MILNIPLPQILKITMTPRAINASNQFVEAFDTADGARLRPIQIMIGPVTAGGRNRITFLTPTSLMISARTRYNRPATTIPPQAYGSFSPIVISAKIPVSRFATVAKPPRNANDEPRNAGTLNFEQRWKNSVPTPAKNNVT